MLIYDNAGWRFLINQQKQPMPSRSCRLAEPCRTANRSKPALRHLGSLCCRVSALCHLTADVLLLAIHRSSARISSEPCAAACRDDEDA